jgi:Rhomboid family
VALLLFSALGTTLSSAVGADSISLGASGIAFALLGASASFGWKRRVRGRLRSHFGPRLLPWLLALFLAGMGSAGVDNWGHAGGLLVGAIAGLFLTPRSWPGDASARRLAGAAGALIGTLSLGVLAAPSLPILGAPREGPIGAHVQVPIGWRRASGTPDRVSYTNGLTGTWRSSVSVIAQTCRGKPCGCDRIASAVEDAVAGDLWRLADVGALRSVDLAGSQARRAGSYRGTAVEGALLGTGGQVRVGAVCVERDRAPLTVVVLQTGATGAIRLEERVAASLRWPVLPPP